MQGIANHNNFLLADSPVFAYQIISKHEHLRIRLAKEAKLFTNNAFYHRGYSTDCNRYIGYRKRVGLVCVGYNYGYSSFPKQVNRFVEIIAPVEAFVIQKY